MLVGYVSDERYMALADVALEFINDRGESWEARLCATGAVHLDVPAGKAIGSRPNDQDLGIRMQIWLGVSSWEICF